MQIRSYPFGPLQANLYTIQVANSIFIIDPCVPYETLALDDLTVKGIFCTHAHYDHILEADHLREQTGSELLAYIDEIPAFKDAYRNGSQQFLHPYQVKSPICELKNGDLLTPIDFDMSDEEPFTIRIMHTPGHSSGSMSILFDFINEEKNKRHLFTGDTVFAGTIGRTDLGGSMDQMRTSISKIATLSDDVMIYPGHGEITTVGREKLENPYFTPTFYNNVI